MAEAGVGEADERTLLKRRVADTIRGRIETGVYRPGDKLPSIRELSRVLQVSVTTVIGAYGILEIDGYVVIHHQSGVYVRLRQTDSSSQMRTNPPATPVPMTLEASVDRAIKPSTRTRLHFLSSGAPNIDLLPTRSINAAMKKVALRHGDIHNGYFENRGFRELREQIAQLAMLRGHELDPTEIVITNGCTEALMLALQTVVRPGQIVAVESPAYTGLLNAMKSQGLTILEIPSYPDQGMDVAALEALLSQHPIAAVFATPNFGNPLGSQIPLSARERLVELLAEREIPLIEDDIYSDLSYSQRPIATCKSLDRNGLVLLCSSFSKTLCPGMRVGWVAAGRFDSQVLAHKTATTFCTSPLCQIIISEFLREHRYSRVVARAAEAYHRNVRHIAEHVRNSFPAGTYITEPAGGFLLWIQMPDYFNSRRLAELSYAEGILFVQGADHSAHALYGNCLRLSAAYWDKDVEEQVARLGELASLAQVGQATE